MTKRRRTIIAAIWIIAVVAMAGVVLLREFPPTHPIAEQPQTPGHEIPDPTLGGRAVVVSTNAVITADDLPMLYDAPVFSLTDQNNQPVTNGQLSGHPWVADFIFTQCASLCPMMSTRLSSLQSRIERGVKFVSFSVDPKHDTPAALLEYAGRYKAEPGRWIFLTGPAQTEMRIVSGMKMFFSAADAANPIQHDQHFVLVDGRGHVRGVYDSNVSSDIDQLVHDADLLADSHPEVAEK